MPKESNEQAELELISLDDAVKMSNKGKSTIRRWRREGLLTKYQMDKKKNNSPIAIDKHELHAFLSTQGSPEQHHRRPTVIEKTVSIDMLKRRIETLEKELNMSIKREQMYEQSMVDTRLSTTRLNDQLSMLSTLLKSTQEDLRLANQQITEHISRHEQLRVAAALYQAECEKGFLGRLFTRPTSLLQLPRPKEMD